MRTPLLTAAAAQAGWLGKLGCADGELRQGALGAGG
eukprot:SAG11_NODE_21991_length_414_cov_1.260317_2_plen_35_part_01